jgi:hypothetical protein
VATLLQQDSISYFYLVDVGNGVMRHASINRDLVVGGVAYSGNNTLVMVDAPRLSPVVDRESYKVTYLDNDYTYKPLFEAGFVGKPFKVMLGFFNTTGSVLNGVQPGEPLLSTSDIIVAYEGFVDTQTYVIGVNDKVTLTIEGASPMGSLDLVRSVLTSKDYMNQIAPGDTSFDQLFLGSAPIQLLWGKKE